MGAKAEKPKPPAEGSDNHCGMDGREGVPRKPGELVAMYSAHNRIVKKKVMTLAYGLSGRPKVLKYELNMLVRYGGLLTAFKTGTILVVDNGVLMEMGKLSLVFMTTAIGMYCAVIFGITDDLKSVPTESLVALSTYMNGFVPFVLSLYVTLALSRWWALRVQALGSVFDAVANTVMLVSCSLPKPSHAVVRDLVTKWGIASIFLLVKAARASDVDPEDLNDVEKLQKDLRGILSESEVLQLRGISPYGRAMTMWGWIMRLCQSTFSEAEGPAPHAPKLTQVFQQCISARNGVQTIHTYLQTQLPFAYVHLITLIVECNNIVVGITCGVVFMVAWDKGDTPDCVYQILMFLLVPVLYHGLLSISYVIHDPFGEDMLDFPIAAFVEYVAQCCDAAQVAQETFPGAHGSSQAAQGYEARRPAGLEVAAGVNAAVTSAAVTGSQAAVNAAVDSIRELKDAISGELGSIGRELHSLHDAVAASELRRKRDADKLCWAILKQAGAK